mmetsp:Transcript_3390/g.6698  ORF Transcript_3390/g.6698 Transcript_3390/m.6698 type:complete len:221 (+) Transcript_3390:10007-10669(+)
MGVEVRHDRYNRWLSFAEELRESLRTRFPRELHSFSLRIRPLLLLVELLDHAFLRVVAARSAGGQIRRGALDGAAFARLLVIVKDQLATATFSVRRTVNGKQDRLLGPVVLAESRACGQLSVDHDDDILLFQPCLCGDVGDLDDLREIVGRHHPEVHVLGRDDDGCLLVHSVQRTVGSLGTLGPLDQVAAVRGVHHRDEARQGDPLIHHGFDEAAQVEDF